MGDSGDEINQPMGIEIINHQMGYNTTEHRILIEPNPDLFDSTLDILVGNDTRQHVWGWNR